MTCCCQAPTEPVVVAEAVPAGVAVDAPVAAVVETETTAQAEARPERINWWRLLGCPVGS